MRRKSKQLFSAEFTLANIKRRIFWAMRVMMEAARISETSVGIQLTTRQYIPEDSELHTHRRENLKSHIVAYTRSLCTVIKL
jgi:hypothetical protein